MNGQLVTFEKVGCNLVIKLLPEGKEAILEELEKPNGNIHSDQFMCELFEYQTCNGWEWVAPEDIGALTSAPILSDDITRDDHGKVTDCSVLYWFPDYQITCPVEELLNKGEVVFKGESE